MVSAIGRNRVHCQLLHGNIVINRRMSLHNVEHIESEELDRQAVQIMQLVGVREGTVVLPGFTRDDVDQREREREREHCLLQLDELDSNYDKNTQLYIIMYDKVNIKINIHIISH